MKTSSICVKACTCTCKSCNIKFLKYKSRRKQPELYAMHDYQINNS